MSKKSFSIKESDIVDEYQLRVLNQKIDHSFIVKGCAGSGKSIMALLKAKEIQTNKAGSILCIVKTNSLKSYMKEPTSQYGIPDSRVVTYNKCFNWSKRDNQWIRGDWKMGLVDFILLDEAQDLTQGAIQLLMGKFKKAFFIFGDSAQQLYDFDKNNVPISMEEIERVTKYHTELLHFNYRLPKKIARIAEYVNPSDNLEARCQNEGNDMPKIFEYYSFEEQLDAIDSIIKARGFKDVGILLRSNPDVQTAYDYLRQKGNYEYRQTDKEDTLNFNSDNPKIMTYHNAKGLQFEAVFLPECSCGDEDSRNALYVALTRSYQSLYIMHSGNLSTFFDGIPTNLYESTTNETEEL